ncbi:MULTISPECIES: FAD-dependent oxidoreductase [unclassified Caballeronia]|uniref:FAD-dependent oxidoreductase n=1 Tax=unclassified Caballeronia TaxID=2646786 RepID=UPI002862942F|nr:MULTISPECIES: FAD-dependent oxidoreductase [unclassified Caballeronia]MDR5752462.1 FAD-dependent oxidoreductase [Caballeronia sp. LZ024]MDR5845268.1 FAD-dependent oxidoreductase [Caballeronia sp. LZ031]
MAAGATEANVDCVARYTARLIDEGRREFAGLPVHAIHTWACAIDTTPDLIPVISDGSTLPGFCIASGFSGHGFAPGPTAGELLGDMVTGARSMMGIAPYRLERFSDGTAVKVPEIM